MAKSEGQKLKILHILKLLENMSDESHPLTTTQIIAHLNAEGISCERKTVYSDIAQLIEFGYDIVQLSNRRGGGYYLASREFELPELKLLVDVVSSSRFITTKKSRELIKKLEQMAGKHDAGQLQRQVYVAGRVKTENESIYYSIDNIHRAIQEDKQIQFTYLEWNLEKKLVARGGERTVSPWALIWKDENYYLVAYEAAGNLLKHFRVDKMGKVLVLPDRREGKEFYEKLDLAAYTNPTFGMFRGEEEMVTMSFPNRLVGVVLDRFGKEVSLRKKNEDTFQIRAKVSVSGQYFGWLAGLGAEARILTPESVKEQYKQWLLEIINRKEENES